MKSPFDRFLPPASKARSRKGSRKAAELQAEPLEKRAMMAIFAYDLNATTTLVAIDGNQGLTDLYIRGLPGNGGVQLATNQTFETKVTQDSATVNGKKNIYDWVYGNANPNLHTVAAGKTLQITNATPNGAADGPIGPIGYNTNENTKTSKTEFVLSYGNVQLDKQITVKVSLGTGVNKTTWTLTNDPAGTNPGVLSVSGKTSIGTPYSQTPTGIVIGGQSPLGFPSDGIRGVVSITWDSPVDRVVDLPTVARVDYSYQKGMKTIANGGGGFAGVTQVPWIEQATDLKLAVSAEKASFFSYSEIEKLGHVGSPSHFDGITLTNPAIMKVGGTYSMTGRIFVQDASSAQYIFDFTYKNGVYTFTPAGTNYWLAIKAGSDPFDFDRKGNGLRFVNAKDVPAGGAFGGTAIPALSQEVVPGSVTLAYTATWLEYTDNLTPTDIVVRPGFDISNGFDIDLTRTFGNSFQVLSPIINAPLIQVFGVGSVNFEAPVSTSGAMVVGKGKVKSGSNEAGQFGQAWFGVPAVDTLSFNAATAASSYTIEALDTVISTSGSLSGALPTASGVLTTASALVDLKTEGSVLAEGTIFANEQRYDLVNNNYQNRGTQSFTTRSSKTGLNTGLIRGDKVVVTMGQAGAVSARPDPINGDTSFHTVDLRTDVNSFRSRAVDATGGGTFPGTAFYPYLLTIEEKDGITFDAVAGSSRAISLSAGGNINFLSGLYTEDDVTITATRAAGATAPTSFTVSAPIQTVFGKISLDAGSVFVNNTLSVTNAAIDPGLNDVTIVARSGDLVAQSAISAVNNVSLQQRKNGRLPGKIDAGMVNGRNLSVDADGDVVLGTTVDSLNARVGGSISVRESDDISVSVASTAAGGGRVAISAAGFDPASGATNPRALTASLIDVSSLEVSAPNGSIDVTSNSPRLLRVGGSATPFITNMQAAGNVKIRSTAGELQVFDAPLAGGAARAVRAASTAALDATYIPDTASSAGTLTGTGSINANSGSLFDSVANLAVGDRVLVANGALKKLFTGSISIGSDQLTVTSGSANVGDTITGAGIPTGTTVKAINGWTLTLSNKATADNGSATLSATVSKDSNGVYVVARVGGGTGLNANWQLTRATDSDSTAKMGSNTFVRVGEGSTLAGTFQQLNYATIPQVWATISSNTTIELPWASDSPFWDNLAVGQSVTSLAGPYFKTTIKEFHHETGVVTLSSAIPNKVMRTGGGTALVSFSTGAFGSIPITVARTPLTTNIGSDAAAKPMTFIVSSTGGTNSDGGSLGKMIQLYQQNDTSTSTLNPNQLTNFEFAKLAGPIQMTQELPRIVKPIAIVGKGAVIDGSRITTTRTGSRVVAGTEVNAFEFASTSTSSSGQAGSTPGASISGLTIGGFANGAAIKVSGVAGILASGVTLGRDFAGNRLANKFGLLVTGSGANATVQDSTIVGSTSAGVQVEKNASGVTLVGTTVGAQNQNNTVGLQLDGGTNRIGVNPLPLASRQQKATTTIRTTTLSLPSEIVPSLFVGQAVTGTGVAPGSVIAAINGSTVTLSKQMTMTRATTVTFGLPKRNTVQYNLDGMVLTDRTTTVTNTDVGNNTYDGIRITGGTQTIGVSTALGANSNAIYGNGGRGVNIASSSNTTINAQKIQGNYFGTVAMATVGPANIGGNVWVNNAAPSPSLGFTVTFPPNVTRAIDRNGNQHVLVSTKTGTSTVTQPWRPK